MLMNIVNDTQSAESRSRIKFSVMIHNHISATRAETNDALILNSY
jgi:hypothetical protein